MKISVAATLALASLAYADSSASSVTEAPSAESSSSSTKAAVARTASINGFADPLYDVVPECAKACLGQDTSVTPCPYWDAGCLCVMSNFAGAVGLCIAEQCQGDDVVSATSLANSICSSAGVPSPYWRIASSVSETLDYAATAIPSSEESSEVVATSSVAESSSEEPEETETSSVPESSITDAPSAESSSSSTKAAVARTASINGFADPLYDVVPECAKACLGQDTSVTPCPYWDAGCLCVMSNFAGAVGLCIAEQCQGDDVVSATSLANSICSSAGVPSPYWRIASSVSETLDYAATAIPSSEESSEVVATSEPVASSDASSVVSESSITDAPSAESSSSTKATVARTASINGFADPLYDVVPECAKACLGQDTSVTPCPYWDTGCLCVMSNFAGAVGLCIAEQCQGDDVVSATSLANSICSSAGVPSPYWRIASSVSETLDYAATAIPSSEESSEVVATSEPVASSSVPESSVTDAPETSDDDAGNQYTQYPSVPKTASINGFADPLYDVVPECAKACLAQDTSVTPCPYWDTGCLCVMPSFGGAVGLCIAEQCQGEDVVSATSLAQSVCSSAGVWEPYWMIPSSVSDSLNYAATAVASGSAVPTSEAAPSGSAAGSSAELSSEQPQETGSAVESSAIESSTEPSSTVESSDAVSSASDIPSGTPSLVTCYLNDEPVDEVDYETGICEFELPSEFDAFFNFVSSSNYNIQYFYARVNGEQFTNDIRAAGRTISIPAKTLYKLVSQVHQVSLEQSAGAQKRDEVDDFLESIADTDGTAIDVYLSADSATSTSSAASEVESTTSSSVESTVESGAASSVESGAASSVESGAASSVESGSGASESIVVETVKSEETLTVTETCTDDEGITVTSTIIVTTHITEYCEQTSAAAVQSSACDEQSSLHSVQSSACEEQSKVVTTIYSCESAKSSLESVKSSAESAHKTEIVASCESELSSIKSVESVAYVTLTSLIEVQESCISKQTSLVAVQSSAASVQLSAAKAQESSRAVEYAKSAVSEASKAAEQVETVVEYITLTVNSAGKTVAAETKSGVAASTITSIALHSTTSAGEKASSSAPAVEVANAAASFTSSAFALLVSTGIFLGLLI